MTENISDDAIIELQAAQLARLRGQVDGLTGQVRRLENNLKMTDAVGQIQEMAHALKPLVDWIREVRESIRETGGCDYCEEGMPAVVMEEGAGLIHFEDGQSSECENSVLQELYRRGLISPEVYTRCEAGHDWFGSGCPECHPEVEA